jgi:hypothetical protein
LQLQTTKHFVLLRLIVVVDWGSVFYYKDRKTAKTGKN